jgi:hypothetical protein
MADTVTILAAQQVVAPYEANLIAQAQQKRLAMARPATRTLAGLRASLNRVDHALAHAAEILAEARSAGPGNRPYHADFSGVFYWAATIVILSLELALNKGAVEQLRMIPLHAWATAAFVSMMNFLCAKGTARVLRRRPWLIGRHPEWILALVATTTIIGALYQLGLLRALDMAGDAIQSGGINISLGGSLAGGGSAAAPQAGVATPTSPWAFLLLQADGYLAVMLLSFFQIDPDEERDQLSKRTRAAEKRLHELWTQRERLAILHNRTLAAANSDVEEIAHDLQERISQYRDSNMRARGAAELPAFFNFAVSSEVLKPIELGLMVDEHPRSIGTVVADEHEPGDEV